MKAIIFIFLLFNCLFSSSNSYAQDWEFIKEQDGIRVYTRHEPETRVKSFKAEAKINASVKELLTLFTDPDDKEWWDENIREYSLVSVKIDHYLNCYLVYDIPWPFTDRDIYSETYVTYDTLTGWGNVITASVDSIIPENPDFVRIPQYWQQWTIEPLTDDRVHIVLEGFADPGGNIPVWFQNMFVTNTPMNIIENIRDRLE